MKTLFKIIYYFFCFLTWNKSTTFPFPLKKKQMEVKQEPLQTNLFLNPKSTWEEVSHRVLSGCCKPWRTQMTVRHLYQVLLLEVLLLEVLLLFLLEVLLLHISLLTFRSLSFIHTWAVFRFAFLESMLVVWKRRDIERAYGNARVCVLWKRSKNKTRKFFFLPDPIKPKNDKVQKLIFCLMLYMKWKGHLIGQTHISILPISLSFH